MVVLAGWSGKSLIMDKDSHCKIKLPPETEIALKITGQAFAAYKPQIVEISKVFETALLPVFDFQKRIQEQMKPWAELMAQVASSMKPLIELHQQMERTVLKFGPIIARGLKEFEEFHGALVVRHKEEKLALPPFFNEMSLSEIRHLFRDKEKPAIQIYDEYFSKKENTDALLKSWSKNEFFRDRLPIFEQALDAHRNGQYALTIPTLLIQIESILEELLGVEGFGSIKTQLSKIIPEQNEIENSSLPGVELTIEIICEQVYLDTREDLKQEYPNRHRTLHGKNLFYYKEKYASLRCIILLDLLRFKEFDIKGYQDEYEH